MNLRRLPSHHGKVSVMYAIGQYFNATYGHFHFKLEKKFPQGAKKKSTLALKLYMIFSVINTLNYIGKMLELT